MNLFGKNGPAPGSKIYMHDNDGGDTGAFDWRRPRHSNSIFAPLVDKPSVTLGASIKVQPAAETLTWVLDNVGARPWDRDATDNRILSEVVSRGGSIRDTPPVDENR